MWIKVIDHEKKLVVCSEACFEGAVQGEAETAYDGRNYLKGYAPEKSETLKAKEIRYSRNALLSASDWTQLSDNVLSAEKRAQWALYRQFLRDIPEQSDFPKNVTWPEKPE